MDEQKVLNDEHRMKLEKQVTSFLSNGTFGSKELAKLSSN
jgi:hypothetical protein